MTTKVYKATPAEQYLVGGNGEHANIFVSCTQHRESVFGGLIVIASSYGNWSYVWSNTGNTPFKNFLCGVRKDYLSEKLMGTDAYVIDWEVTNKKTAAFIRENLVVARKALLVNILAELERTTNEPSAELIEDFGWCDVEINEIIEANRVDKLNSNFEYFWDELWVPFIEELKKEIADGA